MRFSRVFYILSLALIYLTVFSISPSVSGSSTTCYNEKYMKSLSSSQNIEAENFIDWILKFWDSLFSQSSINFPDTGCKISFFLLPASENSKKEAIELLDLHVKQRLEIPGFKYEFQYACREDKFILLDSPIYGSSSQQGKIVDRKNVINRIKSEANECFTSINQMENIVQYISDSLAESKPDQANNKIFLFIQVTSTSSLNKEDISKLDSLSTRMDEIKGKERLGGIYLFGNTTKDHANFAKVFHSVADRVQTINNLPNLVDTARKKIEGL